MFRYDVGEDGSLKAGESREVPMKTQGLLVTKRHFILSSSLGRAKRSNIYVVNRAKPGIDQSFCFRAPR